MRLDECGVAVTAAVHLALLSTPAIGPTAASRLRMAAPRPAPTRLSSPPVKLWDRSLDAFDCAVHLALRLRPAAVLGVACADEQRLGRLVADVCLQLAPTHRRDGAAAASGDPQLLLEQSVDPPTNRGVRHARCLLPAVSRPCFLWLHPGGALVIASVARLPHIPDAWAPDSLIVADCRVSIPNDVGAPLTEFLRRGFGSRLETLDLSGCLKLTALPDRFVEECTNLQRIVLLTVVQSIGDDFAIGCTALTDVVNLSSCMSLQRIGNCFAMGTRLRRMVLPLSVCSVGSFFCSQCPALETADLSRCTSLACFGAYGFANSPALTRVVLAPESAAGAAKNFCDGCPTSCVVQPRPSAVAA